MDIWEGRAKKILTAKSKLNNFGKVLSLAKLIPQNTETKEWEAKDLVRKLTPVEEPKRGDLVAFEEMDCFLGSTLFYLGILTDPKEMKILSQEHGKLTIDNKTNLANRYVIPYLNTSGYRVKFYRK